MAEDFHNSVLSLLLLIISRTLLPIHSDRRVGLWRETVIDSVVPYCAHTSFLIPLLATGNPSTTTSGTIDEWDRACRKRKTRLAYRRSPEVIGTDTQCKSCHAYCS